ncbi:hypothetical protein RBSWK_01037 [Rhodopirellula baltica SWK14]|uniref:Uncharacterized protein n=1 Tax=Rhodopirellula baltica SWK14 TaxID=993516 RepID=L7CN40_RHOBT|nr:hypothetical protein RBSWK_01037 [Rhodopirellula baltica SWK14]
MQAIGIRLIRGEYDCQKGSGSSMSLGMRSCCEMKLINSSK